LNRFSVRTARDRAHNALAQALDRMRARGESVLDLTLGNPTLAELELDAAAVLEPLGDARSLTYCPEPLGLASARAALARELSGGGLCLRPERIVLTASTSEAYAFLLKLLCDPGDEVLVPVPSYPLVEQLAELEGVRPVPYPLVWADRWCVDLAALRGALTPRTRAIVAVSPNNPTGSYLARHELEALVDTGLPIVCDEVFARYPLRPPQDAVGSALVAPGPGPVFVLGGLSKHAGLPQMKLGWIAVGGEHEPVREVLARLEWIADAYLSVASPQQHALPRWLEAGAQRRAAILVRIRRNLAQLERAVSRTAVSVLAPEGGWYAVLRLPALPRDEDWAIALLERDGVLAHPGWLFDFAGGPHLVISLLPPEKPFDEGVARLCARACIP
jgi:aspartate/methionine/tyrosine aminotransferase